MDLVERYLAAVGRDLPEKTRGDIIAELRDLLYSQAEEREAELGRPLERGEQEQLLIAFGHPLVVAGRYRKVQHLIGPEVFPFWWATLRVVLAIVAGIYVVALIVAALSLGELRFADKAGSGLVGTLIWAFGVVTLVFAAIERFGGAKTLVRWRPKSLPPAHAKPRSRFETTVEIGVGVVFILWWTGVIRFRDALPAAAAGLDVAMAPVWAVWFWPILAYSAVELAINLIALGRPAWVRLIAGLSGVKDLAGAAILSQVLQAGHFVEIGGAGLSGPARDILQANVDRGFKIGVAATIIVLLVKAGVEAWRIYQASEAPRGAGLKTSRANG